jgi:hypothetical protein
MIDLGLDRGDAFELNFEISTALFDRLAKFLELRASDRGGAA